MSKRPAISLRMKIDALLFWANTQDNIQCPLCPEIIAPGEAIDWDHAIPLGLGGEHHYTNIRPLHRACHRPK